MLKFVLAMLILGALASAEEYQCRFMSGCTAARNENGALVEHEFRRGDIVSTEAGWIPYPDNGWYKLRNTHQTHNPPFPVTQFELQMLQLRAIARFRLHPLLG